jgi:hypothetical protein
VYAGSMTTDTEVDISKLEKIRALLDKAESTADLFPAEAEALTAKAIELMERYRIDEAMIADARPSQDRGEIIEKTVFAGSGPYVNARVMLADSIARNHSVRLLIGGGYRGKTLYFIGYETDVALTEMLYTSLLVQATRALGSSETRASKPSHVHGTSFCRSFLLAFAETIGMRLNSASRRVEGEERSDGRSVALVLADRKTAVDEDVLRRYGKLRPSAPITAGSSWEGAYAGARAAQKADLGTDRRVSTNTRKAISA